MGAAEVESFLTDLAVTGNVAASKQNQALAAILFLYHPVLEIEPPWLKNITRAKRSQRVPVVLTTEGTLALIGNGDAHTTQSRTHVLNSGSRGVLSPLGR